jgi:methyl-accepting chemotaxis protein
MDEVTQQNAALVEEAAAASQSMEEQAARLAEVVKFFRTGEVVAAVSAPATAPALARPSTQARAVNLKTVAKVPAKSADGEWEEF